MENWGRWIILYCLVQVLITVFFLLYFTYLFITLSTSIEILKDLLPKIIEHNEEIERAKELLPK